MTDAQGLPTIDGAVVQRVVLVDQLHRTRRMRSEASSLPGHLVQVTISGHLWQETGGRRYKIGPGTAVWYHDDERVCSEVVQPPWVYYTANFLAPTLGPPPYEHRVKQVDAQVVRHFERLLTAWRNTAIAPMIRHMEVHARLLDLLMRLVSVGGTAFGMEPAAKLWWDLEAKLRGQLNQPLDLKTIQELTRRSLRTIIRSCHSAVGMAPMRRVRQMRLSLARGLVLYGDERISEIARHVGYGRVQEFSRDYRKEFRCTPTQDRAAGPDYPLIKTYPASKGRREK